MKATSIKHRYYVSVTSIDTGEVVYTDLAKIDSRPSVKEVSELATEIAALVRGKIEISISVFEDYTFFKTPDLKVIEGCPLLKKDEQEKSE